jgi:hypothetical protein
MTITSSNTEVQAAEFQREDMMARNWVKQNGDFSKQEILTKENV